MALTLQVGDVLIHGELGREGVKFAIQGDGTDPHGVHEFRPLRPCCHTRHVFSGYNAPPAAAVR